MFDVTGLCVLAVVGGVLLVDWLLRRSVHGGQVNRVRWL